MSTCLSLPRVSGKPKSIHPSDTQAAYCLPHFDHISHWRQAEVWKTIAQKFGGLVEAQFKFWWHLRSSFGGIKFWWHTIKFGGIVRSSLVASTQFWWLSSDKFGGQCVCVWYQFNYRHKNHPKKYQWWSCHASLVVNGQ